MVARGLRDAGMEVIYTGLYQTAEQIVNVALQEDVDVIGLSILHGAHDTLVPEILTLMKKNGINGTMVLLGGIIPKEDVEKLKKMGVAGVFGPETPIDDIVTFIQSNLRWPK